MANNNGTATMQNPTIIRTQTMVAFVTGVALTLIASAIIFSAWSADAATTEPGDVYVAIDPTRAYDGRIDSYAESGRLAPGASKTISVKDGHDLKGNLVAQNAVPAGATSITYNLTIAGPTGPNFVAVTPGDSTSFLSSAINFKTSSIANAGNVKIDANRQIKVWGGGNTGSMFVIIDITGYYLPKTTTGGGGTGETEPPFDGSNVNITDSTFKIETVGDIPGQATDSGTSNSFNKVRFSVASGVVTGTPGDDGNPSNGKTSNADPGSTFDSNTIRVTIAGGFGDPANPTSIGSRWDFKVEKYENGIASGTYARTNTSNTDTGIFQMCPDVSNCPTPLPTPTVNIIQATDSPSTCPLPSTGISLETYDVQFTGTTPGVAPPSNPSNNRFDVKFSVAQSGAITGETYKYDNTYYTLPSGSVLCGNRTVTILWDNNSSLSSPDGTWTLSNVTQLNNGFSGDYTSNVSTGVSGVEDVGTFTMIP